MKKITIFFIFASTHLVSYSQNNNNSLKEEFVQILKSNQYPQVRHFTTIAYLYTGYQTSPIVPVHSDVGHYVTASSYGVTYKPDAKTIISPDKQYKAFIFPPTDKTTSICISNMLSKELIKMIPLFDQKLASLQFYPKVVLFSCKEAQLDIINVHKLPLNKTDPEKTCTLKSTSPLIVYLPEKDITLISGDYTDTNPFNIIVLNAAFKKYAILNKHTDTINAFASPVATPFFASASDDGSVIIWKYLNQELDTKIACDEILTHKAPVKCICSDPTGKYIISGTHNNKKEVHFYVWDLLSKTTIFTFPLKHYIFDPIPISCSWNQQGKNVDELDTQSIILESNKFYYETTPEKLFEVIELQKKWQATNNNNNTPPVSGDSSVNELTTVLSANLKIENDNSTTLQSTDLSPDSPGSNQSDSSNENNSPVIRNTPSSTDNPASIGSGRTPSY